MNGRAVIVISVRSAVEHFCDCYDGSGSMLLSNIVRQTKYEESSCYGESGGVELLYG